MTGTFSLLLQAVEKQLVHNWIVSMGGNTEIETSSLGLSIYSPNRQQESFCNCTGNYFPLFATRGAIGLSVAEGVELKWRVKDPPYVLWLRVVDVRRSMSLNGMGRTWWNHWSDVHELSSVLLYVVTISCSHQLMDPTLLSLGWGGTAALESSASTNTPKPTTADTWLGCLSRVTKLPDECQSGRLYKSGDTRWTIPTMNHSLH